MIYQSPLAYLLGVEGVALLRAYAGEYDQEFTEARLAEVRRLIAAESELGPGAWAVPVDSSEVYKTWADSYDCGPNQLIDVEQPLVRAILDRLPVGVALDAACGTGRHGAYLDTLGHQVIGVDSSPQMLAKAREKIPDGRFFDGNLEHLPLDDDSVDLVVCALSLTHVPDLGVVLAEFARVLRPSGHLVISDSRGLIGYIGPPVVRTSADDTRGYLPSRARPASEYLEVALPLGFELRRCQEPRRPYPLMSAEDAARGPGGPVQPEDIWEMHHWAPDAANAVFRDNPIAIIWHFQLGADEEFRSSASGRSAGQAS